MNKIVKDINTCTLFHDNPEVHLLLSLKMALYVDGYQFTPLFKMKKWDGKRHFYSAKTHKFPSGLLDHVVQLLKTELNIELPIEDVRAREFIELPLKPFLLGIELRPYQLQAAASAIEKQNCILKAATNAGKTECSAEIIRRLGLPTLFIVDRKELMYQTAETLSTRLGVEIGLVGDGKKDIQLINVVMPQSFVKYETHPVTKTKKVVIDKDLMPLLNCPVLFLDECDNISSNKIRWMVSHSTAYYRFAMSGTPLHNDDVTNMELIGQFGEVAFEITNQELITLGHSSVPTCYFVHTGAEEIPDIDYPTSYKLNIVCGEKRNDAIIQIARKASENNKSVIIICQEIEHGNMLGAYLNAPFIHGGLPTAHRLNMIKQFKNDEVPILISSTILDRGLNISNIDVLILAAGGKSTKRILQRIGRGLRKKASNHLAVVDFLDLCDRYMSEHTALRHEAVKAEGFEIVAVTDIHSLPL